MKQIVALLLFFLPLHIHALDLPAMTPSATEPMTRKRLFNPNNMVEDYWKMTRYFEGQTHGRTCGVASLALMLNFLDLPDAPTPPGFSPSYGFYTETYVLNHIIDQILPGELVLQRGIKFSEMASVLDSITTLCFDIHFGDQLDLESMRSSMINALSASEMGILINFHRKLLDQVGGGHWSVIAGYDVASDSFLMVDVAKFKYPPFWVPSALLLKSVQSDANGHSRGYFVLEKP